MINQLKTTSLPLKSETPYIQEAVKLLNEEAQLVPLYSETGVEPYDNIGVYVDERAVLYGMIVRNNLVGAAVVQHQHLDERTGATATSIEHFAVKEQFRGKGLGRKLMKAIAVAGDQAGDDTVSLESISPSADAFYDRLGFDHGQGPGEYSFRSAPIKEIMDL